MAAKKKKREKSVKLNPRMQAIYNSLSKEEKQLLGDLAFRIMAAAIEETERSRR